MRSKELIKNLKEALTQDYLYSSEELKFMKEALEILEKESEKTKRKKPEGFGKK
tara:strand:+ start:221 stop:382 length:162 start_codon:yes stop_codon:yes gene_type:complete